MTTFEQICFWVQGIRLLQSIRDKKYYLCMDISGNTTFSIRISQKEFYLLTKTMKKNFPQQVIE